MAPRLSTVAISTHCHQTASGMATEPPLEPTGKPMQRSGSWMWDWKGPSPASSTSASRNNSQHAGNAFQPSPPSSRNNSLHGGGAFKPSPPTSRNSSLHGGSLWNQQQAEAGGSTHGGSKMRRNVSFSGNVPNNAPSRESSLHGGSLFGGMRRNNSWIWDWKANSNANSKDSSPNGSLHDKNNFGPGGEYAVDVKQDQGGGGMRRSLSFLWDWGKFRKSPVSTPGNSLHGGSNFAPEKEPKEPHGELPYEIPKALTRNGSVGSFLWNWGWERASPPMTPGNSLHGGNAFKEPQPAATGAPPSQ